MIIMEQESITNFKIKYHKLNKLLQEKINTWGTHHTKQEIPKFDDILTDILEQDPTTIKEKNIAGKYSGWIYKIFLLTNTDSLESITENLQTIIYDTVYKFNLIANQMKNPYYKEILSNFNPNINDIKSIDELQDYVEKFKEVLPTENFNINLLPYVKNNDLIHIHSGAKWNIYIPLTMEQSIQQGSNTSWCTQYKDSSRNMFSKYKSQPLFIIINKKNYLDKYQFYILYKDSSYLPTYIPSHYMNQEDKPIELFDFLKTEMELQNFFYIFYNSNNRNEIPSLSEEYKNSLTNYYLTYVYNYCKYLSNQELNNKEYSILFRSNKIKLLLLSEIKNLIDNKQQLRKDMSNYFENKLHEYAKKFVYSTKEKITFDDLDTTPEFIIFLKDQVDEGVIIDAINKNEDLLKYLSPLSENAQIKILTYYTINIDNYTQILDNILKYNKPTSLLIDKALALSTDNIKIINQHNIPITEEIQKKVLTTKNNIIHYISVFKNIKKIDEDVANSIISYNLCYIFGELKNIKELSADIQLKLVQQSIYNLKYINMPQFSVQTYALDKDIGNMLQFNNITTEIQEYAIRKNPFEGLRYTFHFLKPEHSTELIKLQIDLYPHSIILLEHPSRELQLLQLKGHPENLSYINNPDEDICIELVKENGYRLCDIKPENRTDKIEREQVKRQGGQISYIKNPSEELQLLAISKNPNNLMDIMNRITPTDEQQFQQVSRDQYLVINILQQKIVPSERVQLAQVKKSGVLLKDIIQAGIIPSELVQLEQVKNNILAIDQFKGQTNVMPSKQVIEYYKNNKSTNTEQKIQLYKLLKIL